MDDIINGCVKNELWAQKKLYEEYAPVMLSICMRYMKNRDLAQDVMHDGFIKIYNSIKSFSGLGSFEGWMKRIVINTALEALRKKDALKFSSDINDGIIQIENKDTSIFAKLAADDILECVSDLPTGFRTVFNMFAIEGYSHSDIAKELNISEGTSRSQFARARQALKTMISDRYKINE